MYYTLRISSVCLLIYADTLVQTACTRVRSTYRATRAWHNRSREGENGERERKNPQSALRVESLHLELNCGPPPPPVPCWMGAPCMYGCTPKVVAHPEAAGSRLGVPTTVFPGPVPPSMRNAMPNSCAFVFINHVLGALTPSLHSSPFAYTPFALHGCM